MKTISSATSLNKALFFLSLGLLLFFPLSAFSQSPTLTQLNQNRLSLNQKAMWVLSGWAVANIASGFALRANRSGSERYFHEMNAFWNLINLGIGAAGLISAYNGDPNLDLWQTFNEQQKLEKILLVNGALNISYIMTGVYLRERSLNASKKPERLKGYGNSLILQGAFLLVFDVTQFLLHHNQAQPQLRELLSHVQASSQSLGLVFNF